MRDSMPRTRRLRQRGESASGFGWAWEAGSKFSHQAQGSPMLHPRRAHRAIEKKEKTGLRRKNEAAEKAAKKATILSAIDNERVRRLRKLLGRQEAAGAAAEAAATRAQIEDIVGGGEGDMMMS